MNTNEISFFFIYRVEGLEFDTRLLIHIKEAFNLIIFLDMTIWKLLTVNKVIYMKIENIKLI